MRCAARAQGCTTGLEDEVMSGVMVAWLLYRVNKKNVTQADARR